MDNALYFPNINLPSPAWTLRTLLYWDKLHSIIPESVARSDSTLSATMVDLIKTGLVASVDYGVLSAASHSISPGFAQYLERQGPLFSQRMKNVDFSALVHIEKISTEVSNILTKFDLGRIGNDGWVRMKPTIANSYLSILALNVASITQGSAVTDRFQNLGGVDKSRIGSARRDKNNDFLKGQVPRKNQVRNEFLSELFPVPAEPVIKAERILKFKEKHGESLRTFRIEVEREAAALSLMSNIEELTAAIAVSKKRFKEQANQAAENMRIHFGEIVFNIIVPAVTNFAAYCISPAQPAPITTAGALLQAAYVGYSELTRRDGLAQQPMAYAAFVGRRF